MVGHHLDVVLPRCLGVDDEQQVEVERGLHHVVHFDGPGEGYMRVAGPKVGGEVHVDVLQHGRARVQFRLNA